jgi:hypothetical protein
VGAASLAQFLKKTLGARLSSPAPTIPSLMSAGDLHAEALAGAATAEGQAASALAGPNGTYPKRRLWQERQPLKGKPPVHWQAPKRDLSEKVRKQGRG